MTTPDTPLDITLTSPADWAYISEGGSSIVFSYTGPPHDAFDRTALRLRKAPLDSTPATEPDATYYRKMIHELSGFPLTMPDDGSFGIASQQPPDASSQDAEADDPTVVFQREVIARLLPEDYLPRLEAVRVDAAWLEELRALSEERRPAERRAKDAIDTRRKKAVLATDLVGGKSIAVEIKPKWGFMPSSTHLSTDSAPVKTSTCRFCMHSTLKSTQGQDASLGYCPLDLFSGEEPRVRKALHALWDAWISTSGASNNLRVFVEGLMLRPNANPSSISSLASELGLSGDFTLYTVRDAFVSRVLPTLLSTSLLRVLSNLQRTLDALDIEGLSLLWARAQAANNPGVALASQSPDDDVPPAPPLGKGAPEPTIDEWTKFLDIYLAKHIQMDHDHPDIANLRYYCLAYLLSASFKDCSIILRIPETGQETINVIDLDVKPISRLSKWEKLDQEIVEAYRNAWKPKQCVGGED